MTLTFDLWPPFAKKCMNICKNTLRLPHFYVLWPSDLDLQPTTFILYVFLGHPWIHVWDKFGNKMFIRSKDFVRKRNAKINFDFDLVTLTFDLQHKYYIHTCILGSYICHESLLAKTDILFEICLFYWISVCTVHCDLDLWPLTLILIYNVDMAQVHLQHKYGESMSNRFWDIKNRVGKPPQQKSVDLDFVTLTLWPWPSCYERIQWWWS